MKKLTLIIILLAVYSVSAQTDDKETLKQLNQNLVAAHSQGKYDEALKIARQTLDLSVKLFGAESVETAIAYKNVGVIYQEKMKFRESIENLEKSLAIYQKLDGQNGKYLAGAHEALAISYSFAEKKKEAEENYIKSLEWNEKVFGRDSKETLGSILSMARFYAAAGDLDNSDLFFLRSYEVAVKNFGKGSPQVEKIHDTRVCSYVGSISRQKTFNEVAREIYASEDGTILNGKALNLLKPEYPPAAKAVRASGSVPVKIKIDEQGNVVEAKNICGHPLLQQAAKEAAMKSKFSPTLQDGKPIPVRGYVIYNFLAM
jgi:TonB family protein